MGLARMLVLRAFNKPIRADEPSSVSGVRRFIRTIQHTLMKLRAMGALLLCLAGAYMILGCSKATNPLAPSLLAGQYTLLEFTDKRVNVTFIAGIPTDDGSGNDVTVTGGLSLTSERFTLTRTHVFVTGDTSPRTVTETVSGTYAIAEAVFNISDEKNGQTDAIPISVTGRQLILEDSDFRFVFQRD